MGSQAPSNHILITGGGGFIGQDLAAALLDSNPDIFLTLTDVVEPPVPPAVAAASNAHRVECVQADLTDPSAIAQLFRLPHSAVYLLHGLMSGGAEADLELGWRVNWDSHRAVLDYLRHHHPGTVVVFPSSLAVYGPPVPVTEGQTTTTSETTCPRPQSSYGAQKLMVETYLVDMSRRGLLDGRVVRLPTVIVRPGTPSAAASSFASGVVREPLAGVEAALPVPRDLRMWVCSPETVAANLVRVKDVPASRFGLGGRVVNLPGITVTVQEILEALEAVGGMEALALVKERYDPKVEAIVASWPAQFDISLAMALGMQPDVDLVQNVRSFARQQGLEI